MGVREPPLKPPSQRAAAAQRRLALRSAGQHPAHQLGPDRV